MNKENRQAPDGACRFLVPVAGVSAPSAAASGGCAPTRPPAGGRRTAASRLGPSTPKKHRNTIDAAASRFAPKTKSQPSEAVVIWRGGARERADDVFFAMGIKRRRSKADFAPTWCA